MAKKEKETSGDRLLLKDAIEKYAKGEPFVFLHKYGVSGEIKVAVSEIDDKLLGSDVINIQQHHGGKDCGYNAILFIIK